ncbi:hypothetical protein ACMAUO_18715 [Gluconacetobacter sp. Hr-1-5]|uniref:hypothetical protein n=1 Tax=Gluconacetobacter sp. Hr-1-5 TaxID=3395370 RepID=UPI003B524AEC
MENLAEIAKKLLAIFLEFTRRNPRHRSHKMTHDIDLTHLLGTVGGGYDGALKGIAATEHDANAFRETLGRIDIAPDRIDAVLASRTLATSWCDGMRRCVVTLRIGWGQRAMLALEAS